MTTIAPSLLSANFLELGKELERFDSIQDLWLHLDIMDGHFVPNLTFGETVLKDVHKFSKHPLDAHLMVKNPEDYIDIYHKIGVHNFTFHWEATHHHDRLIQRAKELYKSVGVSLNPATDVRVIPDYILKKIDLVLIMSVNPGFGGQKFIDGVFEKISYLKNFKEVHKLDFHIQVDGGVNAENAVKLIDAGATNLVAGSFIFKAKDNNYKSKIDELRK